MTYRTILVAASGGSASGGAIELAAQLARRFNAHLEGFHVKTDPRDMMLAAGDGVGVTMPAGWIDGMNVEAKELAARTRAAFEAAVARHGLAAAGASLVAPASANWREEVGHAPLLLSARARFCDLAVLGRSERVIDEPASTAIEETLIHSGRPVLLAPADVPATVGEAVALAWDGSPAAVRAAAAALPFIRTARSVSIVTIGDARAAEITALTEYLAWHGVAALHCPVRAIAGVNAGRQLLDEAASVRADLLVMGGYGHAFWRELLFGGATREVTWSGLLPILLSH